MAIDAKLRAYTLALIAEVRQLLSSSSLPPPVAEVALCQNCSLMEVCQPLLISQHVRIQRLQTQLFEVEDEG